MRPHLFITRQAVPGLRSLHDLQETLADPKGQEKWGHVLAAADDAVAGPVLTPWSVIPGRAAHLAEKGWRDYGIVAAACRRVTCAALASLVTGESRYAEAALNQIESFFDEAQWPEWVDQHHTRWPADLRTGQICFDLGLAYDWLWHEMSEVQRQWMIAGLERRGIGPFWRGVELGASWANGHNNWFTVIVGGLGVLGMALGDDYLGSGELVDYALPRMIDYLDVLGPDGEFNESPGYAGSMERPTAFFEARRYATEGKDNRLTQWPFPQACRWILYSTAPPGYTLPVGDTPRNAVPKVTHFAMVAGATRDPVLQWFYLQHNHFDPQRSNPALELLSYDPSLKPLSPDDRLPVGRAFTAHGGIIVSRCDWDPASTPSLVFSKTGKAREIHGHHDNGQVCLDGWGEPLLIDIGSLPYPPDYFDDAKWSYYHASCRGHNVPQIGGRETSTCLHARARLLASDFDPLRGGWWQMELEDLYEGATKVRRTVVHLLPALVAVLDDIVLREAEVIGVRWHTATPCKPTPRGAFAVAGEAVRLMGRIVRLDGSQVLDLAQGQHAFAPPFDTDRTGALLEDPRTSYVDATCSGTSARILSLFAVCRVDADHRDTWQQAADDPSGRRWRFGEMEVLAESDTLVVQHDGVGWHVPLGEAAAI